MRVIIIHQHDPGASHVGGIGTFIETLIKYAPADFEVSLVGVSADPTRRPVGRWQRLSIEGKTCDFLPVAEARPSSHKWVPISLRFTLGVARYRRVIDFRGAILEFHRIEPALALKALHNPKVLFLHAHMQDLYNPKTEVMWGRFPRLYFWLERRLIRAMQRVYIVREDAVPFYQARYPGLVKRVSFLPTWVDETVFIPMEEAQRRRVRQELAQEHGFDPNSRLLLFVGRFDGQKDPLLLLEAFRWLNGQVGQALLILIGRGRLEPSMRHFVQKQGLANSVRILGPRPQSELVRWMNSADCLVLSSAFEGMPRVVVEALRCGLPVVATDAGEVPRLLQDARAGRLVRERTPEAVGAAIAKVLQQTPDREACTRSVEPFTAAKLLADVYASYRALAEQGQ